MPTIQSNFSLDNQTVVSMLAIAGQANVPTILWGTPGEGKSSTIEAIGDALGFPTLTFIGSIHDPTDLGFPYIKDGVTYRAKTDWILQLEEYVKTYGGAILFLDELTTCAPAMQAAMLRVILDRVVGSTKLPNEVIVFSAANEAHHAAGGQVLTRALANRLLHIDDFEIDAESFIEGIMNEWPTPSVPRLPDNWYKTNYLKAATLIGGYIHSHPGSLRDMPDDDEAAGKAWASPRTWHKYALKIIAAAMSVNKTIEDISVFALVSGCVGYAKGIEFRNFVKNLDLPDPEDWISNPSLAKPLKRTDATFTALLSVVSAVRHKNTKERWEAASEIVCNIAEKGDKDVAAVSVSMLQKIRPTGARVYKKLIPIFGEMFSIAGVSNV